MAIPDPIESGIQRARVQGIRQQAARAGASFF